MNWVFFAIMTSVLTIWPGFVKIPFPAVHTDPISGIAIEDSHPEAAEPYFKGHGLNPSWKLEMNATMISFESEVPGCESFSVPHSEPAKELNRKSYDAEMPIGLIHIEIIQEPCTIEGSNESFAYRLTVEVSHAGQPSPMTFEGCGHYVTDVNLTGTWVVKQIKEQPVTMSSVYAKLPSLDIQPKRNSFSGFSGCNNISGRIFSERDLLRFTDIVSTKMMCDQSELESAFLEALQFSTQFSVDGNQLTLSNPLYTTLLLTKEE